MDERLDGVEVGYPLGLGGRLAVAVDEEDGRVVEAADGPDGGVRGPVEVQERRFAVRRVADELGVGFEVEAEGAVQQGGLRGEVGDVLGAGQGGGEGFEEFGGGVLAVRGDTVRKVL